jgi:hypothetical protein
MDNNRVIAIKTGSDARMWIISADDNGDCVVVSGGVIPGITLYGGTYGTINGYTYTPIQTVVYDWSTQHVYFVDTAGYIYSARLCNTVANWSVALESGQDINVADFDRYTVQIVGESGSVVYEGNDTVGGVCLDDINDSRIRITVTITVNGISFSRTKYFEKQDGISVKAYIPDYNTALFYTIQVTDASGVGLSGYKVSVERYVSAENAYVTISEMYTNPDGTSSHFLQPSVFYKIKVVAPDGTVKTYDWYADPNLRTVRITWSTTAGENTGGVEPPEINRMWDRITYTLTPTQTEWEVNDANVFPISVIFNITDSNSGLQYYYMKVTKWRFGTPTVVFETNISGNPSGGTITYDINDWGRYVVEAGFYLPDYNKVSITRTYIVSKNILRPTFISGIIGDTTYIFIVLILAIAATATFARVAPDYAGVAGLAVLGLGAVIHPTTQIGNFPLWAVVLLSAITYIAWKYITSRV